MRNIKSCETCGFHNNEYDENCEISSTIRPEECRNGRNSYWISKKRESIIINLTPHDVKLLCDGKEHVFLKSGTIARVSSKSEFSHSVNGLPVHKTIYGEVENLPEPQEGVIYIVALLVAQVLAGTRTDIICPDTGPDSAVRDDKGLIAGVKRFMIP